MAKKKSPPPDGVPLEVLGRLHPTWKRFFEQFLSMSTTQDDATNAAGATPTKAEFDALVAKFNALIDKLQAAGMME